MSHGFGAWCVVSQDCVHLPLLLWRPLVPTLVSLSLSARRAAEQHPQRPLKCKFIPPKMLRLFAFGCLCALLSAHSTPPPAARWVCAPPRPTSSAASPGWMSIRPGYGSGHFSP